MPRIPITAIRDHHRIATRFLQKWLRLPDPPPDEDVEDPTSQTYLLRMLLEAVTEKADDYCQNTFGFPEYGTAGYVKKSPQQLLQLTQSTGTFWFSAYDPLTDSVPTLSQPEGSGDVVWGSGDPTGTGLGTDASRIVPTIPRKVEMWVLRMISRYLILRPNGLTSESISGLASESWGPEDFSGLDSSYQFHGL